MKIRSVSHVLDTAGGYLLAEHGKLDFFLEKMEYYFSQMYKSALMLKINKLGLSCAKLSSDVS